MNIQHKWDLSGELAVHVFHSGIKLAKPDPNAISARPTVSDLLNVSCSVYFETSDGVIQLLNERNAEFCGFDSVSHAIGKRYFDTLPVKTASQLRYNDDVVMREQVSKLFEENILQNNNEIKKAISIKLPWYDRNHKIMGLFGMSILMGDDAVSQPLIEMAKMGFLSHSVCELNKETIILSRQQQACANLLLNGMTNKQIAKQLSLSPRTVESYLNHLKIKLNCKNKMELIARLSRTNSEVK
jgi:DNA-binding CsgD family transcriptional regulator